MKMHEHRVYLCHCKIFMHQLLEECILLQIFLCRTSRPMPHYDVFITTTSTTTKILVDKTQT